MKTTSCKNRGFTLLEMMLVVMIIGLLLAAAVHFMSPDLDVARSVRIKADIDSITTQLKMYQALNGFYPTTEQGLQALVTRPQSDPKPTEWHQLLEQVPLDPWQNPYIYENPGKHNQNSFDLYSAGPGGKPGTGNDVGNWNSDSK
jgi:general secretion pathway protein G